MPLLSIIIPTHNRQELLKKAIESALVQTLQEIEIIVIDDGSREPATCSIKDPRVFIHRHASPRGAAAARNRGIQVANSAHLCFLDDDDTLDPAYASTMLDFMGSYSAEIDFAWPTLRVFNVATGETSKAQNHTCLIKRNRPATEESYAASAYTRTTGMMFKTETLRMFGGFDETLTVSEDRELVFRMLSKGCGCGSVNASLVNFFIHPGPRLSTNENLVLQAQCDALIADRHADFIAKHPKLASRYLNLLARRQKDAGLHTEHQDTLLRLLKITPFDIRALKRLVFSSVKRKRS
ncbi:glycosyltransferase family 2 protein [Cycloclasticus pugetii]|uniref:glycosyltransferase family 2 protein n=1 Tax=Cycloclasticus pugetii TaxID=34068 RepID=UPI003A905832